MSHTSKNPVLKYTTSNLPSNPPVGTLAYDETEDLYKSFNGSSWSKLEGSVFGSSSYFIHSDGRVDTVYGNITASKFSNVSDLDAAVLGTSCSRIFSSAFWNSGLSKIVIPSTVTDIAFGAFENCSFVSNGINLPEGLLTIGNSAFGSVTHADLSLKIPSTVTSVGLDILNSSNITSLDCYVEKIILNDTPSLTSSNVSTIHVRSTDATWTAGAGQSIGGKSGITVIKDL